MERACTLLAVGLVPPGLAAQGDMGPGPEPAVHTTPSLCVHTNPNLCVHTTPSLCVHTTPSL